MMTNVSSSGDATQSSRVATPARLTLGRLERLQLERVLLPLLRRVLCVAIGAADDAAEEREVPLLGWLAIMCIARGSVVSVTEFHA